MLPMPKKGPRRPDGATVAAASTTTKGRSHENACGASMLLRYRLTLTILDSEAVGGYQGAAEGGAHRARAYDAHTRCHPCFQSVFRKQRDRQQN